ncbi:MAG: hypothetical protein HQL31_13265, partial [Planctomycetes bacterium]|nr:hypothetical protein [Planctomycetota bacterium]
TGLTLNNLTSIRTLTLTCEGIGGKVSTSTEITVKPEYINAPKIISFTASPNPAKQGGEISLKWATENTTQCTGIGFNTGRATYNNSGVKIKGIPASVSYTLTCTGPKGSVTKTITPNVNPLPPTISLFKYKNVGTSHKITWSAVNATTCKGINFNTNNSVKNDVTGITLNSSAKKGFYTLICNGPGGEVKKTIGTAIPAIPKISSFTASPISIKMGETAKLYWNSSNAVSCTIPKLSDKYDGFGLKNDIGLSVQPNVTTTYELHCKNSAEVTVGKNVTVTVTDGVVIPIGPWSCAGTPINVNYPYLGVTIPPHACAVQTETQQRYIKYTNGYATQCGGWPMNNDYGEDVGITCQD